MSQRCIRAEANFFTGLTWSELLLFPLEGRICTRAKGFQPRLHFPVVDISCLLRPPLLQQTSSIWIKNNRSPFPTGEIKKDKSSPYLRCAGIPNTYSLWQTRKRFKLNEFVISFIPVHSDSSLIGFINSTRVFSKFRAFWLARMKQNKSVLKWALIQYLRLRSSRKSLNSSRFSFHHFGSKLDINEL